MPQPPLSLGRGYPEVDPERYATGAMIFFYFLKLAPETGPQKAGPLLWSLVPDGGLDRVVLTKGGIRQNI